MSHLTFSDITVHAHRKTILEIDRLSIEQNQFVCLIGPNGAGKTTLLKLICNLQKPNSGTINIKGKRKIGYVPQRADYNSSLPLTVREVGVMGRAAAMPIFASVKRSDYDISNHWLDMLGLGNKINQTFRSLSGGEQQKTLVASAMAAEPKILLLDEPTANLDFIWKKQLIDILDFVYEKNPVTIIMVSHEISLLPKNSSRFIFLDKGRIIADETSVDKSCEYILQKYKIDSL